MSDSQTAEYNVPADRSLELAVLGAILLDPPILDELDYLLPEDFYYGRHSDLFRRMQQSHDLDGMQDPVLLAKGDAELQSLCLEASASCPSFLMATQYAQEVKTLARKRRWIPAAQTVVGFAMNGKSPDEIADYLLQEIDRDKAQSREGWHVQSVADLQRPPPPREWLLEGLIYRGQISMWYGPPGILKTLLLQNMVACMSLGRNWLMRREWQTDHDSLVAFRATRPARVLWLDYDNGEFETQIRLRAALVAYDGLGDAQLEYMSETTPWLALDDPSHVRRLINLALAQQADVIVLDALGMILGGVDENTPDVAKVIAKLKEIRAATGAALLCVHHPSKTGGQSDAANTYNAAGSAKFSNFFEWTVELRRGQEPETIVAEVTKSRGWAKSRKFAASFSYEHFGDDQPELAHELESFCFYPAALKDRASQRAELVRSTLMDQLADGSEMNQTDLMQAIKAEIDAESSIPVGEATIRKLIRDLADDGTLVARSTGNRRPVYYRLAVDPVDRS